MHYTNRKMGRYATDEVDDSEGLRAPRSGSPREGHVENHILGRSEQIFQVCELGWCLIGARVLENTGVIAADFSKCGKSINIGRRTGTIVVSPNVAPLPHFDFI